MKATDYIADRIAAQGVKTVFGYQGGNIAHMIDSIWRRSDMEFVSTYNEQGASFSACGYALENQTIGVAMASSGPGAINLISAIASAYYDSIPTLFITGNVSIPTMKQSDEIRQNAFQENDIVSMVSKVTKYAVTVLDPHEIRYHLEKALYLASEGRPGPVLLDLPHNIQKAELDFEKEKGFDSADNKEIEIEDEVFDKVVSSFSNSKRPVIIIGGGAGNKDARILVNDLISKWKVPVVATLRGLDVVDHNKDNYIGFGGAYGNRAANFAIKHSDVILVLGSRLDERFICTGDKSFFTRKQVFHVDIDPIELGRILPNELSVECDVKDFLKQLLNRDVPTLEFRKWSETIKHWNERYPSINNEWSINSAVNKISKEASADAIFTLDIGINQMCAAQSIELNGKQRCYTSAGHGAMGCSVPLAIGVVYANNDKVANCFVGDGALHMNIQELLMIGKYRLPVHVILNNNNCLGMIRDFQTKAFASRFAATVDLLEEIDYRKIADAYNLQYYRVTDKSELQNVMEIITSKEPCFVELQFKNEADTNPKLGMDMFKQLPLLSDDEIKQMEEEALECGNIISW